MKGTEKQVNWANDILNGFTGTTPGDLMAAYKKAGKEKVTAAGITSVEDTKKFFVKCDDYVKGADAPWIIENKNHLGFMAAVELLNTSTRG